jgi:hypothetical protein
MAPSGTAANSPPQYGLRFFRMLVLWTVPRYVDSGENANYSVILKIATLR